MKKNYTLLWLTFLLLAFIYIDVDGQSTTTPNTYGGGTQYLGWDLISNSPLNIINEATQPINFYTSAVSAASPVNLRMLIDANGNIGMGGGIFSCPAPAFSLDVAGSINIPSGASLVRRFRVVDLCQLINQ